jgi:hypothetical protein
MVGTEMISGIAEKLDVTVLFPSIVKVAGLAVPLTSPLQLAKRYSAFAVAETDTFCPLSYQFTPQGLTVPAPTGLTEVIRLFWVLKLAV